LLFGLVNTAAAGYDELEGILDWRRWILGGAFVGLTAGAIRAVRLVTTSTTEAEGPARPDRERSE
jgi:hypothetical protein